MELRSPITAIKGIGSRTEQRMQKIGVYTVGDILLHYPREYVQYKPPQKPSEIRQEGHHAVIGRVMSVPVLKRTNRMELVQTKAGDLSGAETGRNIHILWEGKKKGQVLLYGAAAGLYVRAVSGKNADTATGVWENGRVKQSDDFKNDSSGAGCAAVIL